MLEKFIDSYAPLWLFAGFGLASLFFNRRWFATDKKVHRNLMLLFCILAAGTLVSFFIINYFVHAERMAEHEKFMKNLAKQESAMYAEHARQLIVGPDLPAQKVPEMPARPTSLPQGMSKPGWNLAMGDVFPTVGISRTSEEFTMRVDHPTRGQLQFRGDETFSRIVDPEIAKQYPDLMTTYISGEVSNSSGAIIGRFNLVNHSWQSGYGSDLKGSCTFEGETESVGLRVIFP